MASSTSSSSRLDAHALLTSQGWRGTGHSLHPTSDATGLKHHLLIRREGTDGRGLGAGRAQQKADAWWLSAFDQALKGLDTGGAAGGLRQTAPGARLDLDRITARGAAKYTGARGLYTCFVRGGLLRGSVERGEGGLLTPPDSGAGTPEVTSETSSGEERKKKKKQGEEETKEERRARRAEKKHRKEKQAEEEAARKEAEHKSAARAQRKAHKKDQKRAAKEALKAGETKEERRARREARRKRKDEKRRKRNDSEG